MVPRSLLLVLSIASFACAPLGTMAQSPVNKPSPDQSAAGNSILQYYPSEAKAAGISGSAVVKCGRDQHGAFENCQVVSESPQNSGFAAAALAITAHAAKSCGGLTEQQRAPRDWSFTFSASPLSIEPDITKPGAFITRPSWERVPTQEDLRRAYPRGARVAGRTVMACEINDRGELIDCKISDETPAGQGFGAAALQLAHAFRMKARTCDGMPSAGGVVMIPIRWSAN